MRSTRKCRAEEVFAGEIERVRHLFTFCINPCPDSALYVDTSPLTEAGIRVTAQFGCSFSY